MPRYVTVRYLTPVYAVVDIDAEPIPDTASDGSPLHYYSEEAVPKVQHGDSEIVRLDSEKGIKYLTSGDVLAESYIWGEDNVPPESLTPEERKKALDVAENTMWPAWEGY
jgi:hypothetical protein